MCIPATRCGYQLFLPYSEKQTYIVAARSLIETFPDVCAYEPMTTFKHNIREIFRDRFLQPQFGDISLRVNEETVRAHKDILGCHSSLFAARPKTCNRSSSYKISNSEQFLLCSNTCTLVAVMIV